jgi:predicted NBD/HSP70 family sugar kinase
MALNPDGAFSIGIKIGRRSLDMLLVDFSGQVRERISRSYTFPDPEPLFAEIGAHLRQLRRTLKPAQRERLHGIGVAAPLQLGGWHELLGVPREQAARWDGIDIRTRVAAMSDLPVGFVKDTAAACVAELVAGRGRDIRSFFYVFVDTFIGGGLVLDSHLRTGVGGNAGAAGSMPLGLGRLDAGGPPPQLLSLASLLNLEERYRRAGLDPGATLDARALQDPWRAHTLGWMHDAAPAIAMSINGAACLLDLDGVIVDGSFDAALREALIAEVERSLDRYSWEGVRRPDVLPGTIGSDARAIGGALLPLYANFAPDRDLFLKLDV